ncbi:MAG: T9SS type A sorting domain-containing protein [Bacteroidetes bacterium]|nr:T9SS type A sorting domain-containing protein [Bacteroidota bacterium]
MPLDLQESIKPNLIKIFPNPAHNEILISLSPALRKSPCVFSIHNMQGQKMFSKKINQPKEMEAFNIEKLPIGQYLLHTQNEKEDFFHIFYKH